MVLHSSRAASVHHADGTVERIIYGILESLVEAIHALQQ